MFTPRLIFILRRHCRCRYAYAIAILLTLFRAAAAIDAIESHRRYDMLRYEMLRRLAPCRYAVASAADTP